MDGHEDRRRRLEALRSIHIHANFRGARAEGVDFSNALGATHRHEDGERRECRELHFDRRGLSRSLRDVDWGDLVVRVSHSAAS